MSVWIYIPPFYYHRFLGSLKDYQLYAICFYSGVGSEGHYYAEALSPSNNVWLRFSAVDICCVTTPGMKNDIPTLMFYRLSTLLWTIHSGETPHSVTPPSLTPSTPLPNNSPLSQTSPIIPNPISPSESPNLSNPIPLLNTTSPSQTMQLPESIPLPNTLATPPHSFHSSVLTTPFTSHTSRQPQISSTNTLSSPFHDRVFRTTAVTSAPEAFHTVLFACHICGFTCSRSRTLAKHIQHQHSSYKCSLCDFRAKDSASLSVHIHKSHTAPFICSVCGHVSTLRKAARQHYLRQHLTKGKFRCPLIGCNASFNTQSNYIRHIQRVHKESETHFPDQNQSSSSTSSSHTTDSTFFTSTQSSDSDTHDEPHMSEPFPLPPSLTLRDSSYRGPNFLANLKLKDKGS